MVCRLLYFIAALSCAPVLANAQIQDVSCDDSQRMAQTLTRVLGAELQSQGLRDPETVLEIWVQRDSGDWVIVQKYTNGTSCIVAMGEYWEDVVPGPA